ncbi:MAG: hypothetical protein KC466_16900 [Myxococcales bacterium]|nr:hypothetical protein [Myxococcales bacterium]
MARGVLLDNPHFLVVRSALGAIEVTWKDSGVRHRASGEQRRFLRELFRQLDALGMELRPGMELHDDVMDRFARCVGKEGWRVFFARIPPGDLALEIYEGKWPPRLER